MKVKKLLSVLIVLTMIMQILPVFASQEAIDTTNSAINYFINDQFNTDGDTAGWAKGAVKSGTAEFTVSQGTAPDGSGALILHTEGGSAGAAGNQPNAYKAFSEKIDFEGKTVVIKTRFMQAGDGAETPAGKGFLKFNQPNNVAFSTVDDMKWNWTNTWNRTDEFPSLGGYNTLCGWFELLEFNTSGLEYMAKNNQANWSYSTYSSGSTLNKWIEAEITINGSEDITISAKVDGVQGEAVSGTLNQGFTGPRAAYTLYNDNTATEWISTFTTLDSLTWETTTKNDIYVDYIQIFEKITYTAQAVIPEGSTVDKDGAFKLEFVNAVTSDGESVAVNAIPEGAVTVEGVEVTESFDAETQTLTLTPVTALAEGTVYKVSVDAEKLAEAGMTYTGTTEFSVTARGKRSTGIVLNDNFADGTDGWEVGPSQEGYEASIEVVEDSGAKDGKALKLTMPAQYIALGKPSNYGNVTKAIGNGIEFKEGKTITLETRIKTTDAVGYNVRVNRPNTLAQVSSDYGYKDHYMIFGYDPTPGYPGIDIIQKISGNDITRHNTVHWETSTYDITNKWVTYKLVFTPSEGVYKTTMTYTDENGAEQTIITDKNGLMKAAKTVIDKEYGLGYYNSSAASDAYDANNFFKSIDRLTFTAAQTGGDVYVDYVKVYEATNVTASAVKSAIKENDSFEFKFTDADNAETAVSTIPEGTITINGVEVTESYDAETQVLTLTPATALTVGNTYTATVNTSKLSEIGITYTGEASFNIRVDETLPEGYYLNDQFNKAGDTNGWIKGAVKSDTAAFTVTQGSAPDGSGALILHTEGGSAGAAGNQPNAFKAFAEKVDFTGKTIVLKTRFMQAGNGEETPSGAGYLKFNQPNSIAFSTVDDMKWNWTNTWNRTDAFPSLSGYNTLCRWFELFEFDTTKLGYMAKNDQANWKCSTYSAVNTVGKWIEAEITIKGSEDISISAKIDGVEGDVVSGTLKQGFTGPQAAYTLNGDKTATEWISTFTTLDSLTWESTTKNDIYVDYIEIYEVELKDAKAQLLNGTKIEEGDNFKLQFMAEEALDADDVTGAVTITGAEVIDKEFDTETQTLTITPDGISEGAAYTVSVNKSYLENKGYAYTGTTTFNVKGIAKRTNTVGSVYSTDFEDGIGTWKAGVANTGYEATVESATDGGNDVLKVTLPKSGSDENGGNQALAHLELANGVKYEEGKVVVIKAKVKNVTNTPYMIKLNRPDSLTQAANIRQLNGYAVASQTTSSGSMALEFGTSSTYTYANGNQWRAMLPFNFDENKESFSFSGVDLTNKWVEWEIVLDGTTNKMNVSATVEGLDNKLTTWSTQNPVSALNPAQVLNAEYGNGTNIKTFNGLDSISFTSADTTNEGILYIDDVSVEIIKDRANVTSSLTVDGNEVETFVTGDVVVPKFTIDPSISDSYVAISVMYVDGVIYTMYIEEISSENRITTTVILENSFTVPASDDVVIKTFVWDKFESMEPLGAAAKAYKSDNITVYVSASGNDDSGTGEVNSPVATLTKAMEVATSRAAAISGYNGSVTIEMADGTYNVSDTIVVSKSNVNIPAGGLYITNAEGARPVITGGTQLDLSEAVKVTDSNILSRVGTDAANNLYVIDLAGINVPAESWPGVKSFGVEALAEAADGITIPDNGYQVSMNGELMVNSRWPNSGYADAKTVNGNLAAATSENVKNGFTLGCTNTNDWSKASDALIFGFFGNGWATQTTPLSGKAGGAVTSKYASRYGVSATHARYYVYNLLEEIDMPYEYYIDRSVHPNKMYFYKPSDVTTGTISFATQQKVLLNLSSVSNVTVDGLTFENTIGRAVSVSQGSNNKIKNCEFRNIIADIDSTDNNAVLDIFSKNCVVDNNHIYNTNGGIKVGSDTPDVDIKTLASANNTVSNNHIENYGIVDRVYVDAINCMGVGNKILNNEIHNSEHLAMRILGFNHTVQYNEIYDVCKETEDAGAIYMGHTWTSRGNKIINNYFHDIKTTLDTSVSGRNPIAAIFLDDHFAGAYIEGNIFADITGDGVRSNRGREGYINSNLFVNCTRHGVALSSLNEADSATTEGNYQEYLDKVWTIQNSISDGTYNRDIWMSQFPELVNTEDEDWVKPEKFTVTNNLAVNTLSGWNGKTLSSGQWIKDLATKIENNEQTTTDPGFNDITNDYTIDISKLTSMVKNFIDVQFAKMGRNK